MSQHLVIDALLDLCNGRERTVTTAEVAGRAGLSVRSAGRYLGQLGLEKLGKVGKTRRRGYRVTFADIQRLNATNATKSNPASISANQTQNHRANDHIENQKELASQTQHRKDIVMELAEQLKELLTPEPKHFCRVKNLTGNWITFCSPDPKQRPPTLQPYETRDLDSELFDTRHQAGRDNVAVQKLGYIEVLEVIDDFDPMIDSGRKAALAPENQLENPNLEGLVQQILLFPGDELPYPPGRIPWDSNQIRPTAGIVVQSIIDAEPRREGSVHPDLQYLAETHKPMLENALARELMWRNRPDIIQRLEQRIRELDNAVLVLYDAERKRREFVKSGVIEQGDFTISDLATQVYGL